MTSQYKRKQTWVICLFFFLFFLIPPSFNKWLVLRQFEVKRLEDNQKCLVSIHSTFLLSRSCLCPLHTKYQITPKQARSACLSVFRFCQNGICSLLKRSTNIRTDTKWDQLLISGIRTCVKEQDGRRGENVEPS